MNSLLKKLVITLAALLALGVGGYFGRKVYKRQQERRLIVEAREYLEARDWRNAQLCLQRSLQINPLSLESFQLMAELLETVGAPSALAWRARLVEMQPEVAEFRLDWSESAIRAGELATATNALATIAESDRSQSRYWALMGAAAWGQKRGAEADAYYQRALELNPTNLVMAANLATIHLLSTNAAVVAGARASLEQLSTNQTVRTVALRHLRNYAAATRNTNDAVRFSRELADDPKGSLGDRIDYLTILRTVNDPDFEVVFGKLQADATTFAPSAFAVGRWMAQYQGTTNALAWLQKLPPEIQTNQPVPLIISDCLIEHQNWPALKAQAGSEEWGESEYYRWATLALAQRSAGEEAAAKVSWRKSLRECNQRLDRLSRLVQVTRAWKWEPEHDELLASIVAAFPKEKWAIDALMGKYYLDGKTQAIERMLVASYDANTNDFRMKNNLANILLLRKNRLEQAHALAKEVYDAEPKDPFFQSTYAYSLFLQERLGEASAVLDQLDPAALKNPAIATYFAVIQAKSGRKDSARQALAFADAAKVLLPEERELVQLAKASL